MTMGQLFHSSVLSFVCPLSFARFDKEFKNGEFSHKRAAEHIYHRPKALTEVYKTVSLQFHDLFQGGLIKLVAG